MSQRWNQFIIHARNTGEFQLFQIPTIVSERSKYSLVDLKSQPDRIADEGLSGIYLHCEKNSMKSYASVEHVLVYRRYQSTSRVLRWNWVDSTRVLLTPGSSERSVRHYGQWSNQQWYIHSFPVFSIDVQSPRESKTKNWWMDDELSFSIAHFFQRKIVHGRQTINSQMFQMN